MPMTERIVVDPTILTGKPCVKGTRLSVEFLLGQMAQGWGEAELLRNYPGLTHEDVLACLAYASEVVGQEKVYPIQMPEGFTDALAGK
jgi:uncharacterized protein (DUF433 family)